MQGAFRAATAAGAAPTAKHTKQSKETLQHDLTIVQEALRRGQDEALQRKSTAFHEACLLKEAQLGAKYTHGHASVGYCFDGAQQEVYLPKDFAERFARNKDRKPGGPCVVGSFVQRRSVDIPSGLLGKNFPPFHSDTITPPYIVGVETGAGVAAALMEAPDIWSMLAPVLFWVRYLHVRLMCDSAALNFMGSRIFFQAHM